MPSLILTWDTAGPRPCPFCISLNGSVWTFKAGTDILPTQLSAKGQLVWDIPANHSMTHGGSGKNCHCILRVDVDLQDVHQYAKTWRESL